MNLELSSVIVVAEIALVVLLLVDIVIRLCNRKRLRQLQDMERLRQEELISGTKWDEVEDGFTFWVAAKIPADSSCLDGWELLVYQDKRLNNGDSYWEFRIIEVPKEYHDAVSRNTEYSKKGDSLQEVKLSADKSSK